MKKAVTILLCVIYLFAAANFVGNVDNRAVVEFYRARKKPGNLMLSAGYEERVGVVVPIDKGNKR